MTSRAVWLPTLFLILCENAAFCQASAPPIVTVRSAPEHPIVEVRDGSQFLNFDMVVQNASRLTLRISQIELSVYDPAHQLVLRKSINTDAFAPSIAVIGKQILEPADTLDVFNPFSEFESPVPLMDLQYSFCILRESNKWQLERNRHKLPDDCDFREQLAVSPRTYKDKTALILPLRGKIFVWEGHDLYAHHLRVPLGDPKVQALKNFSSIPMTIEGDAFGKIYEYFLGKFAMSEGQKGGEFFTPISIVKLIVEIIEPFHGQILEKTTPSTARFLGTAANRFHPFRLRRPDRKQHSPDHDSGRDGTDDLPGVVCELPLPWHEIAKMVDSEMGTVPKGWLVQRVTEAIEVDPTTKVPKDGMKPFVSMSSLSHTSMIITGIEEREGNSGSKFRSGDTLFARITPCLENGKTGLADRNDDSATHTIAEGYRASFSGGQLRVEDSNEKHPLAVQRPAARCRPLAKGGRCFSPSTLPPSPPEKLSQRSQS
jgi:hypothetical protein